MLAMIAIKTTTHIACTISHKFRNLTHMYACSELLTKLDDTVAKVVATSFYWNFIVMYTGVTLDPVM